MAIRVRRDFTTVITSIDQADVPVTYFVTGTDDEHEARAAVIIDCDPQFDGRTPTAVRCERVSNKYWRADVTYSAQDWEYSFDISTEQVTVTQSLQNVGNYAIGGVTPPNFNGAIGVTRDGIQGTSIPVPVYTWNETHYFPPSFVDESYKLGLSNLAGKMCIAPFKGHQRGEVLFDGCTGGIQRGKNQFAINFRFKRSQNVQGLTIGDILIAEKLGWDYVWVNYSEFPNNFALTRVAVSAHVERVIQFGNFDDLRLPLI